MVDAHRGFAAGSETAPLAGPERLPRLQAAGLILVLSLAVWGVIGLAVGLVVG